MNLYPSLGQSELWQHFGLKKGDNGKPIDDDSVYCRLCRRKVKAGSGNTSNLKAHLKKTHRYVYSTLLQPTIKPKPTIASAQPTITTAVAQSQLYSRQSKKHKDLTNAIANFICKGQLPIYTVEKDAFLKMIKAFDSRYDVPSRSHFSRCVIPDLFASFR